MGILSSVFISVNKFNFIFVNKFYMNSTLKF